MQSLYKNCNLKRKISWLLAYITFFMFFISSFSIDVSADDVSSANSLQQNYINLMGGSKLSDAGSVSNIRTTDDLRNIALFLSNAYVPFYTSLDGDSEDANKEVMTSMLKLIGFEENAAKEMTDMTYSASLNSATQLYINWDYVPYATVSNDSYPRLGMDLQDTSHYPDYFVGIQTLGYSTYKKAVNDEYDFKDGKYSPFTVFEFQMLMDQYCNGGNGSWYCNHADNTENDKDILWSQYHGIPLYSMINGEPKVVFVLNNYVMAMLTTLVREEADNDAKNDGKLCNKLINGDIEEISEDMRKIASLVAFTQNIYVDWVGNVLCDLGDQRVVLCPAYLNPCTFTKIDDNTKYDDYNGLGTLPIRYMNKYGNKDSSNKKVSFEYETSLKYRLSDAYSEITFDTDKGKWGQGDGEKFLTIINKLGLSNLQDGTFKDNDDTGFQQDITYKANATIDKEDLCNFLQYKLLNRTSDISASSFISANLLDDADFGFLKYFSSMPKFNSDDSLDYVISFSSSDKQMLQNIFLTYTFAYCNKGATSFSTETNYVNMKFNDLFPSISEDISWETTSSTADEVLSFVYYLLHPSKGIAYVATWLKNKLSGVFVGWHEDIVGSTDSNSTTGMTHYLGFSGYVTTPSLYDIDWIANILNSYNSIIVYILIIMAVILLAYIIIGTMTVQRAILGFLMFAILAFLPPVAINTTINVINTTSDKIYSNKFDYWALCQIEQYVSKLSEIETADTDTDYVKQLLEMNKISNSNTNVAGESTNSYSGVKLKWLSPKRFNELNAFSNEIQNRFDSSGSGLTSVTKNWLVNGQTSASGTEMYLRSDSVGYLYRDILDIYKYASISYQAFNSFGVTDLGDATKWYDSSYPNLYKIKTLSGKDFHKYILANNKAGTGYNNLSSDIRDTSSISYMQKGFLVPIIDDPTELNSSSCNYYKNNLATSLFLKYNVCEDIHKSLESLNSFLEHNDSLNITVDNFSNKSIIFGIEPSRFNLSVNDILTNDNKCTQTNLGGFYHALYSESPFYFFNYNIRDQINKFAYGYNYNYRDLTGSSQHIKNMFLDDNQKYFFNLTSNSGDGYGELRDFMNMHDLFYYIIPALQDGNNLVNTFNDVFNLKLYDDMPVKVNESGSLTYDGEDIDFGSSEFKEIFNKFSDEQKYKFWHNYNVRTVYNCYSSWLNLMSACDYADEEDITVTGKKFRVSNPLDPTSYYTMDDSGKITSGRYMIFSRSEMKYYGLGLDDLTTVEKKIIEVQDNVYKDTLELMNYYTLSDETIIQGYTMIQLFNFNKAFSQKSLVSEDVILYPQSYELKAFTYDAYLRLIIAGSSNEDLMTSGYGADGNTSIYQRVLEKTSMFFGILLIANDFIAVYVIPALKLFFLLIIFFLSILIIIASAIKMEMNILNVVWKSLLAPLLAFGGVSIGLAWLVSKFMSEGAQGVTKTDTIISLGDPTMVILVMLIINIVVLVLYWKICKKCFKDFKKFVTAVFNNALGAVSGAVGKVVGTITAGKVQGRAAGKAMGYSTAKQRGADNSPTSGKSGLGFGNGLSTGAGLGIGAKVGSELADSVSSGSNRYNEKTSLGRAMNAKVDKADSGVTRAEEAKKNTYDYQHSKEDKVLDKLEKKEAKADKSLKNDLKNAKTKAFKNRDRSQANSVMSVKDSDAYKNAKARAEAKHDKKTNKIYKKMDKVGSKTTKARNRADKRLTRANAKSTGLRAGGLNRYKLAAAAGIAGKATAKAMGGALKGTAKVGAKVAKNSAKVVKSGVQAGTLAAGATVSAIGNNLSS